MAVIEPGVTTINKITLQAGSYAMLCFINDKKGGPPHFTQGMYGELTVE